MPTKTNPRPCRTRPIHALLAHACLGACFAAGASAQSIVNATAAGKDRNEYAVWFSSLSFDIRATTNGIAPPPAPTFTIDLYDEDDVGGDDGRDVDLTETSPTVRVGAWTFRGTGGAGIGSWSCSVTTGGVQEMDVTDPLPGDWPDPRIEIKATIGTKVVSVELCAPGLPPVGAADFGVASPRAIANSSRLAGIPIAALSRGFDDISRLPTSARPSRVENAALYFSCSHQGAAPASDLRANPGRVFVLDAAGDLWPEDLYAGDHDPTKSVLGTPRYLNVNTAPPTSSTPTAEIYFVRAGTGRILYSPTGDPAAAALYLDVGASHRLSALAVEDVAPRGVWGAGDRILYAIEGSAAIFAWTHGQQSGYLTLLNRQFDGSTEIGFDHFDRAVTKQSSLRVGAITALAVSTPGRSAPTPADRVIPDVIDLDGRYTYGPAVGGHLGFRNSPVLGSNDFAVTLTAAAPGTSATLYLGVAQPLPGVSLPSLFGTSRLLLDANALIGVAGTSKTVAGAAERVFPIPNAPNLVGVRFGCQWLVFLPATLPALLSDAGEVEIR
jgi:hypothetical protein